MDPLKNVNKFSDQHVLMTFLPYLVRSVFYDPVPGLGDNAEKEEQPTDLREHFGEMYLENRRKVVFYRSQDDRRYVVLRFIEMAFFLLNDEFSVNLDDEIFERTLQLLWDHGLKNEPVSEELRDSILSLTRYVTDERQKSVLAKLEKDCDLMKTHAKHIKDSKRMGVNLWGPCFWGFLHRYVYRLEDKMRTLSHEQIGSGRAHIISDAFLSFFWFVKFLGDFLPCTMCSHNYEHSTHVRLLLTASVFRGYPQLLLLSRPELVDLGTFESIKSGFVTRVLTIEFYLAHSRHAESLGKKRDYSLDVFFQEIGGV